MASLAIMAAIREPEHGPALVVGDGYPEGGRRWRDVIDEDGHRAMSGEAEAAGGHHDSWGR